jgi:uncharacterized membrane protein YdbT with pleckstrin-like domain
MMIRSGFPVSLLSEDEDLVLDLRPHWMTLAKPAAQALGIVLAVLLIWLFAPFRLGSWPYLLASLVGLGLLLNWPVRGFVKWITSHFIVTTDRVILRSGWIAKHSMEIPMEKISDVRFHQRVIERVLGAGDLRIESSGRSGHEVFDNVENPERVQRIISTMRERNEAKKMVVHVPSSATAPPSVADELAKLHRLHGAGVLTDAEFQSVKDQLLRRV